MFSIRSQEAKPEDRLVEIFKIYGISDFVDSIDNICFTNVDPYSYTCILKISSKLNKEKTEVSVARIHIEEMLKIAMRVNLTYSIKVSPYDYSSDEYTFCHFENKASYGDRIVFEMSYVGLTNGSAKIKSLVLGIMFIETKRIPVTICIPNQRVVREVIEQRKLTTRSSNESFLSKTKGQILSISQEIGTTVTKTILIGEGSITLCQLPSKNSSKSINKSEHTSTETNEDASSWKEVEIQIKLEHNKAFGIAINEKLVVTKIQCGSHCDGYLKIGDKLLKVNNMECKDVNGFFQLLLPVLRDSSIASFHVFRCEKTSGAEERLVDIQEAHLNVIHQKEGHLYKMVRIDSDENGLELGIKLINQLDQVFVRQINVDSLSGKHLALGDHICFVDGTPVFNCVDTENLIKNCHREKGYALVVIEQPDSPESEELSKKALESSSPQQVQNFETQAKPNTSPGTSITSDAKETQKSNNGSNTSKIANSQAQSSVIEDDASTESFHWPFDETSEVTNLKEKNKIVEDQERTNQMKTTENSKELEVDEVDQISVDIDSVFPDVEEDEFDDPESFSTNSSNETPDSSNQSVPTNPSKNSRKRKRYNEPAVESILEAPEVDEEEENLVGLGREVNFDFTLVNMNYDYRSAEKILELTLRKIGVKGKILFESRIKMPLKGNKYIYRFALWNSEDEKLLASYIGNETKWPLRFNTKILGGDRPFVWRQVSSELITDATVVTTLNEIDSSFSLPLKLVDVDINIVKDITSSATFHKLLSVLKPFLWDTNFKRLASSKDWS